MIKDSLKEIKRALNGSSTLTSSLEETLNSIIIGKLPLMWAEKSYASLKSLANYITDLCSRLNFFQVK
jgi:dynein heavy chain